MFNDVMYATLFVSDQDKALDFYANLGFEKRADFAGPEGRFFTIGFKGQNLEVILWPGTQGRADKEDRVGRLFVESDDLRKDFDALRSKGIRFVEAEPEDYPFGVRITALDPDGNPVSLHQRKSSSRSTRHPDWNESYAQDFLPWDTGRPDPLLTKFVESGRVTPGRALEVGCGTGTNALWLAGRGFDVLGVDVAPLAVEKARAKQAGAKGCRFENLDFLTAPPPGPFDFVFDRGCFHVFDEAEQRERFAARVAGLLGPDGMWLSLIGSTEGAPREVGPPRRRAIDVLAAIEPVLELVELRTDTFQTQTESAMAWFCLSRQRKVPAQPSTRRD